MKPRAVANPPNPWASTEVEYLPDPETGLPLARPEVFEDHTRTIISHNDSPDVGFEFSVNPYRGCGHACAYCLEGSTRILMGDGSTRALANLRVGDVIYGTRREGAYRRYVRTDVRAHWATIKPAFRISLEDGTALVASADHRFLTDRGWKYVTGAEQGALRRPHLTLNDKLMGTGAFASTPNETPDYCIGYLTGIIRGDGLLGYYRYTSRPNRERDEQFQFRLALVDDEALARAERFLSQALVETRRFAFQRAAGDRLAMIGIRTSAREQVARVENLIRWPPVRSVEWQRGFLAGIFDAEGSYSRGILRVSNTDPTIVDEVTSAMRRFDFDCVVEGVPKGPGSRAAMVRVRGGLREHLRFFLTTNPAISRKRNIEGRALKSDAPLRVTCVEPLNSALPLYDITTGTGDFIAEGIVSHNCYARPGHEFLSMGAGTDFDTKIVIKPRAPELLREAFEKPSWKGELIVFSGVTDCYQPLEASYRLTRGCLEVCAEYRQPVGIITKAPLVERDIDVLQALHRDARVRVNVSVPFWNPEHARAIEPGVATPKRRIQAIEKLAAAGIPVGVMVAPIIPGLSDESIAETLRAARDAGASSAGYVLLRLPGPVKEVFEQRVREAMPLRAEKILHRIRETRGGELYDSRFHLRGVGTGKYSEMIAQAFEAARRKAGFPDHERLHESAGGHAPTTFRRPARKSPQLALFDDL